MNKVMLKGFMTKEAECMTTKTGKTVCNLTIAVNRRFKKDETDFIFCTAWDKTADFIIKYLTKGSEIAIVGRLEIDRYENKEGKMQYKTNVIIEEIFTCGKKTDNANKNNETKENPSSTLPERNTVKLNDDELPF